MSLIDNGFEHLVTVNIRNALTQRVERELMQELNRSNNHNNSNNNDGDGHDPDDNNADDSQEDDSD